MRQQTACSKAFSYQVLIMLIILEGLKLIIIVLDAVYFRVKWNNWGLQSCCKRFNFSHSFSHNIVQKYIYLSYISLRYWCRKLISFTINILFNFILCVMTHSTLAAQFDILSNSFPKPVKSSCEKSREHTRVMQEEKILRQASSPYRNKQISCEYVPAGCFCALSHAESSEPRESEEGLTRFKHLTDGQSDWQHTLGAMGHLSVR